MGRDGAERVTAVRGKAVFPERSGCVAGSSGPPDYSAYIVAVLDRTTLGVSGLDAADRFGASPSVLSTFVVLQVIVYACAQVPAGLLLGPDRLEGTQPLGRRGDGVGAAGARVHRIPAHCGRGAGCGRTRARGDVHLRAAAGAELVLAQAGPPGLSAHRNLGGQLGQVFVGHPVLRPPRRGRLDHRVRVGRGDRRVVDGVDPRAGQDDTGRPQDTDTHHVDPGDPGQRQDRGAGRGQARGWASSPT